MATPPIDISYAAHTTSCTFLLDDEGICRRIVMAPKGKRRESSRTAAKCVGAQYVASLDGSAAGGLVEMPRVGAAMLFARVDERGRVSLVRTGVLTSFESRAGEDPFLEAPSVETSAPVLDDLATPRLDRHGDPRDPDYFDPSERTQRNPTLGAKSEDYDADGALTGELDEIDEAPYETGEAGSDLATAEYQSVAGTYGPPSGPARHRVTDEPVRPTLPSQAPPARPPTLRKPHRDATVEGNDNYARSAGPMSRPGPLLRPAPPSRSVPPRRSDPKVRAAAGAARAWTPESSRTPPAEGSDVQVTRRRRGG